MTTIYFLEKKLNKFLCNKIIIFFYESFYDAYLKSKKYDNPELKYKDFLKTQYGNLDIKKLENETKRIFTKKNEKLLITVLKLNYIILKSDIKNCDNINNIKNINFVDICYKTCVKNLYFYYNLFDTNNISQIYFILKESILESIFDILNIDFNYNKGDFKKLIESESDYLLSKYLKLSDYEEDN